jgi:hypothetical protein
MNGDMSCGAESAIGVVRGAVGVGVCDLNGPQDCNQEDADQRKEDSPGMIGAMALDCMTHIGQMF